MGGRAREGTGERGRSAGAAALVGVGLMAAVDEIVFHQVLGWHHFYDRSTPDVALLSDGLLHAAELVVLVAGTFLLADLLRRRALVPAAAWAGGLLGAGAFQLVDGLVNHKLLRLHQVRSDVADLLPYDLAWNGSAVLLLAAGAVLLLRTRRSGRDDAPDARATGAHAADRPAAPTTGAHAAVAPPRRRVATPTDATPGHGSAAPGRPEDLATPPTGRRRATGPTTGTLPTVPPTVPADPEAARRRRDDRPSGRRAAGR